jgi:hypothetical protein
VVGRITDSVHGAASFGDERPFTSRLLDGHRKGSFDCAGCALYLFSSDTKFNSGTGWPVPSPAASVSAPLLSPGGAPSVWQKAAIRDRTLWANEAPDHFYDIIWHMRTLRRRADGAAKSSRPGNEACAVPPSVQNGRARENTRQEAEHGATGNVGG